MSVEVRAVAKYMAISAHKVRLVMDLVRGHDVTEALAILGASPKLAAREVARVIKSAAANAEENHGLSTPELYVAQIMADEGPTLRRGRAGARGRFKPQLKRSSHITVVVSDKEST